MPTSPYLPCLRRALTVAAGLLPAALVGCSNNPHPPGESARNVRYVAWASDLKTMDPAVSYTVSEAAVIDNIYEAFYRYHPLKQVPYVLEMGLGAEEPTVKTISVSAPNPKTGTTEKTATKTAEEWTFRIRKGLHYSDDPCFPGGKGREVTAQDFIYAWRRMADPSIECPIRSTVEEVIWGMTDLIKHNEERNEKGQPADDAYTIPGLEVDKNDPYTFRIRLVRPFPQIRYLMAMHFTSPVPHEAIDYYRGEFARHPVGCGMLQMTEYRPKQRITLSRNPNRAGDEAFPTEGDPGDREAGLLNDAGKPLPILDKVVFVWTKEGTTAWNLFQQGYLDGVAISQDNFSQVLQGPGLLTPEMQKRGVKLKRLDMPSTWYFAFNMHDPVWGTPGGERAKKLRQAVSLCLDRQQFIDILLQGFGRPAQSMLPPGIPGYEEDYKNPFSRTDVEKAKRLLAEAGYPNGTDPRTGQRLTLTIDMPEAGAAGRQASLLTKRMLEASGIQLAIAPWQSVEWQKRVREGKAQFFRYSWFADYPDPENFWQLLYSPMQGQINYAGYKNPEFDRLFEQMRGMRDGPDRMAVIRKMRAIVEDDCPWIFFYHAQNVSISYPWVHNDKPHGIANDTIRYEAVDGAERAAYQREKNQPNLLPLAAVLLAGAGLIIPAARTATARRNRSVRRPVKVEENEAS